MPFMSHPDASIVEKINPDGTALIKHQVHEMDFTIRGGATQPTEGKKVSKEISRERQKVAEYDSTMTATVRPITGGWGVWYETKPVKSVTSRKEKKNEDDFFRMYRKLKELYEPLQREEMKQKMIARFKTANPSEYLRLQDEKVQTDTRLQLKTRYGRKILTTVSEQKAYSETQAERFASGMEQTRR